MKKKKKHRMPTALKYAASECNCRKVTMRDLPTGMHKYSKQQEKLQQEGNFPFSTFLKVISPCPSIVLDHKSTVLVLSLIIIVLS